MNLQHTVQNQNYMNLFDTEEHFHEPINQVVLT